MHEIASLTALSDAQLLFSVKTLADAEQRATARLIAALGEVERRKLYLAEGCSSMFTYCTEILHLSESAAYNRIEVARVAARFPVILERLADGVVTLTTIRLLAPVLTAENHDALLAAVRHKGKREVEQMLVAIRAQPDVASTVRKLPTPRQQTPRSPSILSSSDETPSPAVSAAMEIRSATPSAPSERPTPHPAQMQPLAPERYKIQFIASRATYNKLRRAQALLRHAVPNGDPAEIVDRALTALLTHLEKKKLGSRTASGPQSWKRAFAPHSGRRPARGLEARRWPVCVHREQRTLHRTRFSGVPPRRAVRSG